MSQLLLNYSLPKLYSTTHEFNSTIAIITLNVTPKKQNSFPSDEGQILYKIFPDSQ